MLINPLPITPHRLPIGSWRSIRRYGYTAIAALSCGRVAVFVLVLALVNRLLQFGHQLQKRRTARCVVETEIALGIAWRLDILFVTHCLNVLLEVMQYLTEPLHEHLLQTAAHGLNFYPRLFVAKLIYITFPSQGYWRSRNNIITIIIRLGIGC